MNKSIFITRRIPEIAINMLKEKGYEVDGNFTDKILTKEELIVELKLKSYDAVLSLLNDQIDKEVYQAAPNVKIFSNYASGFDNLDILEAKNNGVVVANSPAPLSINAVAQHTIALIFSLSTRILDADDFVRQGKYEGWNPMNFIRHDFSNKILAIVGSGRIGSMVGLYAKALGFKIIYTNNNRSEQFEKDTGAIFYEGLEELLPQADFVSLHVPLLAETRHLINKNNLSLMKNTAFLINTSRGPVVDEISLEKAIRDKVIAGAALDVFEFEPKVTLGLLDLPNVILTPHIASSTIEARNQMAEVAAQNIIDFLEGREVKNIVNK